MIIKGELGLCSPHFNTRICKSMYKWIRIRRLKKKKSDTDMKCFNKDGNVDLEIEGEVLEIVLSAPTLFPLQL